MTNHILFVFEGEDTEEKIFESLSKYYFSECSRLHALYGCDVYSLYQKIKQDEFLDLIPLLKENAANREQLTELTRENVSEVYLFFDYDGHSGSASDSKIFELLSLFEEETGDGKLYLSYPMVEAFKHLKEGFDFKDIAVDCRKNIRYKELVNNEGDNCYNNLKKITKEQWATIISSHCKKMNYLVRGEFTLPNRSATQLEVFESQRDNYIIPKGQVAVLSAFPLFIGDYYGYNRPLTCFSGQWINCIILRQKKKDI